VGERIGSNTNRRKAIDILLNIWVGTREIDAELRDEAVARFHVSTEVGDRLWLHYGLTLLYYSLFRDVAAVVGQISRHGDHVTSAAARNKLVLQRGQLGSLELAVNRVVFSLRDWGLLEKTETRNAYAATVAALPASTTELEVWLLACALRVHPAKAVPFADLVHLSELFPFQLTVGVDDLRSDERFVVHREGSGWDMVRLTS
jgi:hypothetical protein